MRTLLRTQETHDRYEAAPKATACFICKGNPWREYQYWKIIVNEFPYDAIAQEHYMLVPKRHVGSWEDLMIEELDEFYFIKKALDGLHLFDAMFENFTVGRTFLDHYHLHLLKWIRK